MDDGSLVTCLSGRNECYSGEGDFEGRLMLLKDMLNFSESKELRLWWSDG